MALIILPIIVFATVVLVVLAFGAPTESPVQARLRSYGYDLGGRDLTAPFASRVLVPALDRLAGVARLFSPIMVESNIRAKLFQAGSPAGLDSNRFLAIKTFVAIGLASFSMLLPTISGQMSVRAVIFAGALAIIGWKAPDLWLSRQVDRRKIAIQKALPDALDLIVVCVEAGNALEAALSNVARKIRGALAEELERTLQEIALGKQRREALRDLSKRTGVADLQSFIAAILQADQLGVSIAQVLRVQAEAMRVRRRQRAEEQAARTPVKMLFPLVMLIFPALMIVILGPAALRIIDFFRSTSPPG